MKVNIAQDKRFVEIVFSDGSSSLVSLENIMEIFKDVDSGEIKFTYFNDDKEVNIELLDEEDINILYSTIKIALFFAN